MKTTLREEGNGKYLVALEGHLDTLTSSQVSEDISNALDTISDISHLTCDAAQLEYISSSGLRILLSLAKRFQNNFCIINVQPQVYEILETTGFTKIMSIERGLRQLSVEGCQVIGIGGVGVVYRLDGDTIIKVFREGTTIEEVRREITMSKEAFVLGMPTAISFDIVRVAPLDGETTERFGLVYELLKAETLSSCLKREPERVDEFARKYADLFRQLHSIQVPSDSGIPSAKENERRQILHIRRYFPEESINKLLRILDAIPEDNRLLHLDLQTKNAMVQDNELMLIDMGEMGYGHPLLDLGHAYSAMVTLVGDYEKIIGIPAALGKEIWKRAIDYYFEGLPADVIARRKAQIEVVSCIRKFSWLSLSDSFPEEVINECKSLFRETIDERYDFILEVCKTFDKWT